MKPIDSVYLTSYARRLNSTLIAELDFVSKYSESLLLDRVSFGEIINAADANKSALVLGARSNFFYEELCEKYAVVNQFSITQALDYSALPVDLVVCSHLFDWFNPSVVLEKAIESINLGGEAYFSFYGQQTAGQLADIIFEVDSKPHFQPLYSMSDIGDELSRLGLCDVVVESERLNLEYNSVEKLLHDAKLIDGANYHPKRRHSLTSKGRYNKVVDRVKKLMAKQGTITLEIELCYARAKKKDLSSVSVSFPTL